MDHIDGHRTVALVISPYTRRKSVDSTNYNQTSMVRTIELILGLPPMNQLDSTATPMASCFHGHARPHALRSRPEQRSRSIRSILKQSAITDPRQLHWAEESIKMDLADVDRADEDMFNRILWHARKGSDDTYPTWAISFNEEEDEHEEEEEEQREREQERKAEANREQSNSPALLGRFGTD